MQYNKIRKAQMPMQRMMKIKLPIRENKKSRQIYKMMMEIENIMEYLQQEEMKIVNKYQGEIMQDGTISFSNDENGTQRAQLCFQELSEFEALDVEWNYPVVTLSESALTDDDSFALSPEEMFCLEGFVEFED